MQESVNASLCECVCTAVSFTTSHVYFLSCLLFGFPSAVLFILEQHVSQVLSEDYSGKKEERVMGTMEKRRRERQTDRMKKEGRQSFERLLASKLTVIVVLARGESTFKHTG